ncbi:MAG: hypothetical protein EXR79_13580 [Myxococcales bacterium]|nr:hypothetical protein [Myxococcales bacterium]
MTANKVEVDVVVIGSGAGGGAAIQALGPLVHAGKKVLLLEKGPRFDHTQFSGQELDMAGTLYAAGGGFPTADRAITLAFAEGLGGSTLVYTGTSVRPPRRVIDGWKVPGLEYRDLVHRLARFERQNGVDFVPDAKINDNNRLFAEGCRKLGWTPEQFAVNLRGCRGSSLCNLGCPNGAKQGTAYVQIPMAERAGVEVVTRARVLRVAPAPAGPTGGQGGVLDVEVDGTPVPMGAPSTWAPGRWIVQAKDVIVACGAVHTPALLLRSGLGATLPALGRWWTCQPAHILVGEHDRPLTNAVGHPKSFLWEERIVEDRYFLEACMYFPFVTAKNLTGFGPEHERLLKAYERLQMILVLACDDALPDQRVAIDAAGDPVVHYRLTDATVTAMVKATRAAARIFFAAGAKAVHAPSARPTLLTRDEQDRIDERVHERHFHRGAVSVSAAHLMGGCRMGEDTATAVTTPLGQVHGVPWLHVADASLFRTALEINPYLTVMALAEHVADAVSRKHGVDPEAARA